MAFGTGDRFVDIGAVVEWLAALRAHASQFGADEEGFTAFMAEEEATGSATRESFRIIYLDR